MYKRDNKINIKQPYFQSQRFYIFFHLMGLDPESFLLEFFLRRNPDEIWENKQLSFKIVHKRQHSVPPMHIGRKFYLHPSEFTVLKKIILMVNSKITMG